MFYFILCEKRTFPKMYYLVDEPHSFILRQKNLTRSPRVHELHNFGKVFKIIKKSITVHFVCFIIYRKRIQRSSHFLDTSHKPPITILVEASKLYHNHNPVYLQDVQE